MSKKKWLNIVVVCLFFVFRVKAQEIAVNDLQRLCEKYAHSVSMHYEANLKMYSSVSPVHIIDQLNAVCFANDEDYYTQIGSVELIRKNQFIVTVDHDDKLIVIAAINVSDKKQSQGMMSNIDELLNGLKVNGTRMQKVMRGNETWLELSQFPDESMLACNIQYDPRTFLVNRVWLKVIDAAQSETTPVIVDITYRYDGKIPSTERLNEKKFVRVEGKKAVLQPAYQHYTLINQL